MPRTPAPAPPVVGDVIRIAPLVIADSEDCLWSLDYQSNGFSANPATDALSILTQFNTNYATAIKALLAADTTFNGSYAYFLSRQDVVTQFSTIGNGVGTGSANHLDKQLAMRVAKVSVLKGAHGRGAFMFGPLPASAIAPAVDANRLAAAYIVTAGILINLLKTPIVAAAGSGNTFTPCVSTRPTTGTTLVTRAQNLFNLVINPIVGTVRRRRLGRGI